MIGYFVAGLLSGFAVLGVVVGFLIAALLGAVWVMRKMPW